MKKLGTAGEFLKICRYRRGRGTYGILLLFNRTMSHSSHENIAAFSFIFLSNGFVIFSGLAQAPSPRPITDNVHQKSQIQFLHAL